MVRKFSFFLLLAAGLIAAPFFGFTESSTAAGESAEPAASETDAPSVTSKSNTPDRDRLAKQLQGLVGSLAGLPTPPEMNATLILPNADDGETLGSQDETV